MSTFRVQIYINALFGPPAGWQEVLYYTPPGDTSISAALGLFNNSSFALTRQSLLTPDYMWFATSLSDVANPRVARQKYFSIAGGRGTFPTPAQAGNSAPPYSALKVNLQFTAGKQRSYHLRGLPINVITNTFAYAAGANPAFDSALNQWLVATRGPGDFSVPGLLQKRLYNPSPRIAVMKVDVQAGSGNRVILIQIASQTVPPIAANDFVSVRGVAGCAWVNKTWRVKTIPSAPAVDGSYTIVCYPHKQPAIGPFPTGASGTLERKAYLYLPAYGGLAVSGAKKDTGRPFGEPRGRQGVTVA